MNTLNTTWLKILSIIMLFGALYPFPFFYYQLMDWVVVITASLSAYQMFNREKQSLMWVFVFIAIIFNPLAPIYLRSDIWQILDIITGLFLISTFLFLKKDTKTQ